MAFPSPARLYRQLVRRVTRVGRESHSCAKLHLGSDYGGWTINPEMLDANSVVYSAGIGEDVSFDLGLIEHFGVTVHGFDPTPRSIAWVKQQALPPAFVLHEYGLAADDGELVFHSPVNPAHVSLSTFEREVPTHRVVLPVRNLGNVMRELGQERLDLLKMDIEGSEYGVITDLVARRIPVRQLLVEFHHRLPGIGRQRTKDALTQLHGAGYRLFQISSSALEYSFVHVDA